MTEDSVDGMEHFEKILREVRTYNAAFEMYLAGYRQRAEDEKNQPSSLRDRDSFKKHIRQKFEREWCDVKPDANQEGRL